MRNAVHRWLLVLLLLGGVAPVAAQRTDQTAVHAAYLVNFLRYAHWPEGDARSRWVIAVIGTREAADDIAAVVRRVPAIAERRVVVRHVGVVELAPHRDVALAALERSLAGAHMVYVAESHASWHATVVEATVGEPVLTVGAGPGFVAAGGMFELFPQDDHVYFGANAAALAVSKVRVSARVINLARPLPRREG